MRDKVCTLGVVSNRQTGTQGKIGQAKGGPNIQETEKQDGKQVNTKGLENDGWVGNLAE